MISFPEEAEHALGRVHVAGKGLGSDGTRARPRLLEDQVEELGLSQKDRGEQGKA